MLKQLVCCITFCVTKTNLYIDRIHLRTTKNRTVVPLHLEHGEMQFRNLASGTLVAAAVTEEISPFPIAVYY